MTEELKKKAKEYNRKNVGKIIADRNVWTSTEQAYITGATEATKELQEKNWKLEEQITKWREDYICLENLKDNQIKELQEEKINILNDAKEVCIENVKLKKQIEKMKCCYNCSKWNDGECKDCHSPIYTMADFNCDKWELAE